ncbi:VPLPA-CTERM sorting domain-containing protein [Pseudoduganella sp.]|uniref:VPLPA-CTERM sorting domain-containing protein n=1 Tax=Pseudoduganella sp. TaxID=1880898 RepID=UPI0035B3E149
MQFKKLAAAALFSLAASAHAGLIDTTTSYVGTVGFFGEPNTATYGQTFSLAGKQTLNSFSMFLTGEVPGPVHFKAYLYEWSGDRAQGPALFTSAAQSFTGSGPGASKEFAFNTGGVNLKDGKSYVAFLSASGLFDGVASSAKMPSTYASVLDSGNFVYINNGNNTGAWTNSQWIPMANRDLWFKASYESTAAVPLPASLPLLGMGLLALGFARRRKA